jgi:hypothetical protein
MLPVVYVNKPVYFGINNQNQSGLGNEDYVYLTPVNVTNEPYIGYPVDPAYWDADLDGERDDYIST